MPDLSTNAQQRAFLTDDYVRKFAIWKDPRPFPDDRTWVSNTLWMLPASGFEGAFTDYGINGGHYSPEEGWYEPDGKRKANRQGDLPGSTVELFSKLLDPATYPDELRSETIGGTSREAYLRHYGTLYAALRRYDGGQLAIVRADLLDVGTSTDERRLPYGTRIDGQPVLRQKRNGEGSAPELQPIAVVGRRESKHGGEFQPGSGYVPVTWRPDGEMVLAVLMPARMR
jgi:hypothetical protein